MFDGWSAAELAAVPPSRGRGRRTVDSPAIPLPPGALAVFLQHRSRMHGLVTLELLDHLHPLQEHAGALFAGAMHRGSEEIGALRAAVQPRSAR